MQSEVIPRNLNKPDMFELGMGLKLKLSDLPILFLGGELGNKISKGIIHILDNKRVVCCELCNYASHDKLILYVLIGAGIVIAFIVSKIKIENQGIIELLMNSMIFNGRKAVYKKR